MHKAIIIILSLILLAFGGFYAFNKLQSKQVKNANTKNPVITPKPADNKPEPKPPTTTEEALEQINKPLSEAGNIPAGNLPQPNENLPTAFRDSTITVSGTGVPNETAYLFAKLPNSETYRIRKTSKFDQNGKVTFSFSAYEEFGFNYNGNPYVQEGIYYFVISNNENMVTSPIQKANVWFQSAYGNVNSLIIDGIGELGYSQKLYSVEIGKEYTVIAQPRADLFYHEYKFAISPESAVNIFYNNQKLTNPYYGNYWIPSPTSSKDILLEPSYNLATKTAVLGTIRFESLNPISKMTATQPIPITIHNA